MGRRGALLAAGALYTVGRALAYTVLGAAAVRGLMSMVSVSSFLQGTMHRLLGPLLIVVGLLLLGLLRIEFGQWGAGPGFQRRVERLGTWGALLLGVLFALSFCPVSAGLFFGSLVPLAAEHRSPVAAPLAFGIGTAVPVAGFAVLLATGAERVAAAMGRLEAFERVARRATAIVFLGVGAWETLRSTLMVI